MKEKIQELIEKYQEELRDKVKDRNSHSGNNFDYGYLNGNIEIIENTIIRLKSLLEDES